MAYRHCVEYGWDCGRNIEGMDYMALVERREKFGYLAFGEKRDWDSVDSGYWAVWCPRSLVILVVLPLLGIPQNLGLVLHIPQSTIFSTLPHIPRI